MSELRNVSANSTEITISQQSKGTVNLNNAEWLFEDTTETELVQLALKAGVVDGINDNTIDENDIKILEKDYGLKLKTENSDKAESLSELGITELLVTAEREIEVTPNTSDVNKLTDQDYLDNIDALSAEIERLDAEIEGQKVTLAQKQEELEEAKARLKQQQADLEELNEQYKAKQDNYEEITASINSATSELESNAKSEQQQAIYQAMNDYNQAEDGPWGEYLEKKLSKLGGGGGRLSSLIETLSGQSSDLATELGSLQTRIFNQQNTVNAQTRLVENMELEISNLESSIQLNEATRAELSEKIISAIMNSISDEEKALVEANNIDLSEKFADGSPKYIFAMGKEDGKYHIYEMDECGTSATSLARKYASGGGFDIIKNGNGYIRNFEKLDDDGGQKVFYTNSNGTAGSFNACYCTSSPLSFDLNGDGVKTSDKIIQYDIDGDGILDNINDSADGILVFDKDGDGISGKDGSECFGDNTDIDGNGTKDGYKDGFEALKSFALSAGVINGADDMVIDADDIKFLEENFGFKMKTGGYNSEAVSLLDLGISEINLARTNDTAMNDDFDGQGNQLMTQDGATFVQNGETKDYADIWHKKH